jgi:ADP-ribose pyrophosphatase
VDRSERLIDGKRVYSGRTLNIDLDRVLLPNGNTADLEVIRHPGASAVVPVLEDGQVVLIHQFRYAAGDFIYEIPAGKLDPGENPIDCARRELAEETGYQARSLSPLLSFLTTPGFCDEEIHIFLARELSAGKQDLEMNEVLEVRHFPISRALEMIREGTIKDGKTIIGLYAASAFLKR